MKQWRISAGTASILKLSPIRVQEPTTTAYVMLGENCLQACKFCAQSSMSQAKSNYLSRVSWPEFEPELVAAAIAAATREGRIGRVCLQVVGDADNWLNTIQSLTILRTANDVPISVSSCINSVAQAKQLVDCGASRIGIALDGATPQIYQNSKQSSWNKRWKLLLECAQALPGKISTHLIVGLGETEQEMINRIAVCLDRDITVGLFAFTPVRGTVWQHRPPPPVERYRRIQVAYYLLRKGYKIDSLLFEQEKLIGFATGKEVLYRELADGKAFQTSGCSDCNRPYYNERPGQIFYNYPRRLTDKEVVLALEQCRWN